MKRVLIVQTGDSMDVTVFGESGDRRERIEGLETVVVQGARRIVFSRGVGGAALTIEYEGDVCLERRGAVLEVGECGARGGEE